MRSKRMNSTKRGTRIKIKKRENAVYKSENCIGEAANTTVKTGPNAGTINRGILVAVPLPRIKYGSMS